MLAFDRSWSSSIVPTSTVDACTKWKKNIIVKKTLLNTPGRTRTRWLCDALSKSRISLPRHCIWPARGSRVASPARSSRSTEAFPSKDDNPLDSSKERFFQ